MKRTRGNGSDSNKRQPKRLKKTGAMITTRRQSAPMRTGGYLPLFGGYGTPRRSSKELKAKDTAASLAFSSDTGNVLLLNGVAVGTDFNSRIGRKFTMKSLLMRLSVFQGNDAAPVPAIARVIIVYDSQANATAPTIAMVLNTALGTPTTRANNLDNRDRFKILLDVTTEISPAGTQAVFEKRYLRLDHETINGGTDATIGSITTGSLYLLAIGDNVNSDKNPKGEVFVRVRYLDD